MSYIPVPADDSTLCRYVAYLAEKLRPDSIKQYLNVIRLLHLESGLANPLYDSWVLNTLLKGIKREKGGQVNRKLPITTDILCRMAACLDLGNSQTLTFWSACLLAFFGMLRKSSLFPADPRQADHLLVDHCSIEDWGMVIYLQYSKTIQYRERKAYIALPWHRNRLLCPARTLIRALKLAQVTSDREFILSFRQGSRLLHMTYAMFTTLLQNTLLKCGLSIQCYSGHSFRRGGASHALNSGVPPEVIRAQGDWKSMSYLDYLDTNNVSDRARFMKNVRD